MYTVDLHTHSRFFHGLRGSATRYDGLGLRLHAAVGRLRDIDGFAVTNHDYAYSAEIRTPTIPGIEITTTAGHVVVVGPNPPSRSEPGVLTPEEAVDLAHARDCAAILAHPYRNSSARESDADFDAVELNGKNPKHIAKTRRLAEERDLPLVGGSDAHYPIEVGRAFTRVEADELSPEAVVDAVRDGRVEAVVKLSAVDKLVARAYHRVHANKGWLESDVQAVPKE